MKNSIVRVLLVAAALSCSKNPVSPPPPPPENVGGVSLLLDSLTVAVGAQLIRLGVRVTDTLGHPITHALSWSSSDPSKATVDTTGTVQVIGPGSVNIIATAGTHADTLPITSTMFSFSAVAAGVDHVCAVTTSQVVVCWGNGGNRDRLGVPDSALIASGPVAVQGVPAMTSVTVGTEHSCGLTAAGAAWCWGDNSRGQLGVNAVDQKAHMPVAVSGGLTLSSLAAGPFSTCGITTGGAAYCWGVDVYGLGGHGGTGALADDSVPTAVSGGLTFRQISSGVEDACGIVADSTAYCWGIAGEGEIGVNPLPGTCGAYNYESFCGAPTQVSASLKFISIAAGSQYVCGVVASGDAYCWGINWGGNLGDSLIASDSLPRLVIGGHAFVSSSNAQTHTCALTTAGAAYCWGIGGDGGDGNGFTSNTYFPAAVSGGLVFTTISAGQFPTCGVASTHRAYCWGSNIHGTLGGGGYPTPITLETTPTLVTGQP